MPYRNSKHSASPPCARRIASASVIPGAATASFFFAGVNSPFSGRTPVDAADALFRCICALLRGSRVGASAFLLPTRESLVSTRRVLAWTTGSDFCDDGFFNFLSKARDKAVASPQQDGKLRPSTDDGWNNQQQLWLPTHHPKCITYG